MPYNADTDVALKVEGDTIRVWSPYNPTMVKRARGLAGSFEGGTWRFATRHEEQVRELLRDIYGTDGTPTPRVTVRFPATSDLLKELTHGTYSAFGRPIARAWGRDSGAKLMGGVVCLEGGFYSGGSMKNWEIYVRNGTVIEMVDVPEPLAMRAAAEYPDDVTIVRVAPVDRSALEAERARLQGRLAEIEALIARDDAGKE